MAIPMHSEKYTITAACLALATIAGGTAAISGNDQPQRRNLAEESYYIGLDIESLIGNLCENNKDNTYYKELASLKDDEGNAAFDCSEIITLQEQGVDIDYVKELAKMRDVCGDEFFTGYDIAAFNEVGGTVEYAQRFTSTANAHGYQFSGDKLPQLYALNLEVKDIVSFTDTEKPNALLVYGTSGGKTFRMPPALELYAKLGESYDLKVVVASVEGEVYAALDPQYNFELAMFSGHGTKTTLTLGDPDPHRGLTADKEIYTLDTSDSELEIYLGYLHPKAVNFLNSCSTAEGGLGANNLANSFATWGRGRTVIAAQEILWNNAIRVKSMYPFDAILLNGEWDKDIALRISNSDILGK